MELALSSSTVVPIEIVYGLMLLSVLFGCALLWVIQLGIDHFPRRQLSGLRLRWKNVVANRKVMSSYEYAFYQALLPAATTLQLVVCPKLSLKQIVRTKDGKPIKRKKLNRYLSSRTVDFVVCTARGEILMAFLLINAEGITDESRIEAEEIYQVLKNLGIPLTRMDVKTKYSAAAIHNILSAL